MSNIKISTNKLAESYQSKSKDFLSINKSGFTISNNFDAVQKAQGITLFRSIQSPSNTATVSKQAEVEYAQAYSFPPKRVMSTNIRLLDGDVVNVSKAQKCCVSN